MKPKRSCISKKAPKASFDPRSFRTIKRGAAKILIGCPKGKWNAKTKTCKVGTRAYEVMTPGFCKTTEEERGVGTAAHRKAVAEVAAELRKTGAVVKTRYDRPR